MKNNKKEKFDAKNVDNIFHGGIKHEHTNIYYNMCHSVKCV